jgi:hypothetical protein
MFVLLRGGRAEYWCHSLDDSAKANGQRGDSLIVTENVGRQEGGEERRGEMVARQRLAQARCGCGEKSDVWCRKHRIEKSERDKSLEMELRYACSLE